MSGFFLLIDKPVGITSHDVVDCVRKISGQRRVGHAGTLDPFASGLLIVGVGRSATRKLGFFSKLDKEYEAEIVFGEERDTDDREGKTIRVVEGNKVKRMDVERELKKFVGEIWQIPPRYSAVRVRGSKAYQLSRLGKDFQLEPRKVRVYFASILDYAFPVLKVKFRVSSGTYIRSLARDLGRNLSTGAYLNSLRRTRIGDYSVEDAAVLDLLTTENMQKYMISGDI